MAGNYTINVDDHDKIFYLEKLNIYCQVKINVLGILCKIREPLQITTVRISFYKYDGSLEMSYILKLPFEMSDIRQATEKESDIFKVLAL